MNDMSEADLLKLIAFHKKYLEMLKVEQQNAQSSNEGKG